MERLHFVAGLLVVIPLFGAAFSVVEEVVHHGRAVGTCGVAHFLSHASPCLLFELSPLVICPVGDVFLFGVVIKP